MHFLRELLNEERVGDPDGDPTNKLSDHQMDVLRKNIRAGCKPDKETGQFQPWANALHLVHKAFEVAGIQRPTPDMEDLWKQYEEIISFAVQELSKTQGIDGSWRMTAHDLHDKS